jgi:Glycosyltransferase family 87
MLRGPQLTESRSEQKSCGPCRWMPTFFAVLVATYALVGWNLRSRVLEGSVDFVACYTAARMVWDGKGSHLYDLREQTAYQERILQALQTEFRFKDGLLAYIHPPFEIVWFIPLGGLGYLQAYFVWLAVSLGCVVAGVCLLLRCQRSLDRWRLSHYFLGSLAFFPVFINLLQGQDSATLFLYWTLSYWNLVRSREATAGACLSLLLQKFQVLLPSLLVLLVLRRWRVLSGFLAGSMALLGVSLALVGPSGIESYARLIAEVSTWIERKGIYPSQMHNLRAQFYVWLYAQYPFVANVLTGLSSVVLLVLLVRAWNGDWKPGSAEFGLKFSLLVTISLLVSPHLNLHDLTCLLLPGLLIGQISDQDVETSSSVRWLRWAAWLVGFPLILGSLVVSTWVPIHLSVWGIIGMVFLLIQTLKQSRGVLRWETATDVASCES